MAKEKSKDNSQLVQHLRQLASELGESSSALSPRKAKVVREEIGGLVEELGRLMVQLDPVREPESFFDPSNPRTIGKFIGVALVAQERHPLTAIPAFYGSGVYALYYNGPFAAYAPLVGTENPIYVGKADPQETTAKGPREQGMRLCSRLGDHLRTIKKATTTLKPEDFTCRYLVVQSGAQTAAEDYLINLFKPIWNDEMRLAYGVGKHGDDPKTRANLRSPWDTLHPGRDWAHRDESIGDAVPHDKAISEIEAHFLSHAPYQSLEVVLKRFVEDLKQR
jgi:hypothetical protein